MWDANMRKEMPTILRGDVASALNWATKFVLWPSCLKLFRHSDSYQIGCWAVSHHLCYRPISVPLHFSLQCCASITLPHVKSLNTASVAPLWLCCCLPGWNSGVTAAEVNVMPLKLHGTQHGGVKERQWQSKLAVWTSTGLQKMRSL